MSIDKILAGEIGRADVLGEGDVYGVVADREEVCAEVGG
jgi:hypothetical protein